MKKQFYSLICSLLLLPGAIAFAAATANKVDLSALSAMTSAELQTYLLALPEADFVKTMQALVASPQLELPLLAAARNGSIECPLRNA